MRRLTHAFNDDIIPIEIIDFDARIWEKYYAVVDDTASRCL